MKETKFNVYLISRPEVDWDALERYCNHVGAQGWFDRVCGQPLSDAEVLVEACGRGCYRSWEAGLNKNVTKVRDDSAAYLQNIVQIKHGSVLEHANFTFVFQDVSRVFTHELVRHRAGVAISQESLRYVRLDSIGFRLPEVLEPLRGAVVDIVERLEDFQVQAAEHFKLDEAGVPFHYKKEVTSALRRLAPLGLSTTIFWTANLRTLRHVLELRTALGAEEEMRSVFDVVGWLLRDEAPAVFADFQRNEQGEWLTPYSKV